MRRRRILGALAPILVLIISCNPITNPPPDDGGGETGPVLVAVGDSITMGIQDAGLRYDFQVASYPYLIARQMGITSSFAQPYLKTTSPGIAALPYKEPLSLNGGEIEAVMWNPEPDPSSPELQNYVIDQLAPSTLLGRGRFHNLGVSGARLFDVRGATDAASSQDSDNIFFDLVLQNVADGGSRTVASQVAAMDPDYIVLWIGNNDILHVVLNGGNGTPTPLEDFTAEFAALLAEMVAITPNVVVSTLPAHLPFVSALDGIVQDTGLLVAGTPPAQALCVFDPTTLEPVDFGAAVGAGEPRYLPLNIAESEAEKLLLSGAIAYMDLEDPDGDGIVDAVGLPDEATLTDPGGIYGLDETTAQAIVAAYPAGMTPTSTALAGDVTLTTAEFTAASTTIADYNDAIVSAAVAHGVPVVDMGAEWWSESAGFKGYSGRYVLQDQETTTFSIDGVHPNDLGQALNANAFIGVMNDAFGLSIPPVSTDAFDGQYQGMSITGSVLRALDRVGEQWGE